MFFILEAEMFEAVLFFIIFVSIDSLVFACIPEFAYKNDKLLYCLCSKEALATFFSNCFVSFTLEKASRNPYKLWPKAEPR